MRLQGFALVALATISASCSTQYTGPSMAPANATTATTTSTATLATSLLLNAAASVCPGCSLQATASGGLPPYAYSVVSGGGTINAASGQYLAPSATTLVELNVRDAAGSIAYASVTVIPAATTLSLTANASTVVQLGTLQFTASGGNPPYSFLVTAGGGMVDSSTGYYTAPAYNTSVVVKVTDASALTAQSSITVAGSAPGVVNYVMSGAASNDVLSGWPAAAVDDQNAGTAYSSAIFATSTNDRGTYIAAYLQSPPQSVKRIMLTPRTIAGARYAFPVAYNLYLTDAADTSWVFLGTFSTPPDATGVATITLPAAMSTYGVLVIPTVLGQDSLGGYYFQLAELGLGG